MARYRIEMEGGLTRFFDAPTDSDARVEYQIVCDRDERPGAPIYPTLLRVIASTPHDRWPTDGRVLTNRDCGDESDAREKGGGALKGTK